MLQGLSDIICCKTGNSDIVTYTPLSIAYYVEPLYCSLAYLTVQFISFTGLIIIDHDVCQAPVQVSRQKPRGADLKKIRGFC